MTHLTGITRIMAEPGLDDVELDPGLKQVQGVCYLYWISQNAW